MIRTVGQLINELEKYPGQMTVRINNTKPIFPNTISGIDRISQNYETTLNPDGAFPIVLIEPEEF